MTSARDEAELLIPIGGLASNVKLRGDPKGPLSVARPMFLVSKD